MTDSDLVPDMDTATPLVDPSEALAAIPATLEAMRAELLAAVAALRADNEVMRAELAALRSMFGLPETLDMADLTPPEQAVVKALAAAWRESQPQAPRTIPISTHAGYSHRQTLAILTKLADRGLIRRNNRISWMPINRLLA